MWDELFEEIELGYSHHSFYRDIQIAKDGAKLDNIEVSETPSVIPEGTLHKNKHHLDLDVTKKGIPVVTVENDQVTSFEEIKQQEDTLQQHAEIEKEEIIAEIGYTIDNTSKTRALFEINKGVNKHDSKIDVNSKVPKELRRVQFENMIYIADGPSDVPAFSLVKGKGGSTFAIYPKGNIKAFKPVEKLRMEGRVDMYAEADYSENGTAYMWISNKIHELAERIVSKERAKLAEFSLGTPRHLV